MKISCTKENLLNGINIVIKAVPSKTTMTILECILLSADDSGFRLIANDLEMGIETRNIDADIIETGSIALEAKIFSEIIRNLPENDLTITVEENNVTTINCGQAEFKILGKNSDEFPLMSSFEKNIFYEIDALSLKNMIKQTIFSVSIDEKKKILTGELIDIRDNVLHLVSVDGFRSSLRDYAFENEVQPIKVVIIAKALSEISRIIEDKENETLKMYFSENQVLFELEKCTIIARLIEGEFVKYESLFNNNYTTKIRIERIPFLRCIERASLITSDNKKNPIKLKINKEGNTEISSNTDIGESFERIDCEIEGEGLEIGFNPKYLIDALKVIDDEEVYVQFMTPLSPCIIKGTEEECNYQYLMIPLKLKN